MTETEKIAQRESLFALIGQIAEQHAVGQITKATADAACLTVFAALSQLQNS